MLPEVDDISFAPPELSITTPDGGGGVIGTLFDGDKALETCKGVELATEGDKAAEKPDDMFPGSSIENGTGGDADTA